MIRPGLEAILNPFARMVGMSNRKLVIPALILSLSAVSCGGQRVGETSSTLNSPTKSAGTIGGPTTPPTVVPDISLKSYVTSVHSPNLVANISYPAVNKMASPRIEGNINSTIFKSVTAYVSAFETSLKGEPGIVLPGTGGNAVSQSEITGSFTKELVDSRYVSFRFVITTYFAGAASSTAQARSLTFDLSDGKLLSLADLFSAPNYLPVLSSLSRTAVEAKLGQSADQSLIVGGTQPNAVNFANWNLAKAGLEVTFSQGQVGAAAAGIVSIILPYADFAQLANRPGPLANP